ANGTEKRHLRVIGVVILNEGDFIFRDAQVLQFVVFDFSALRGRFLRVCTTNLPSAKRKRGNGLHASLTLRVSMILARAGYNGLGWPDERTRR
ncbi:MAG: hypothetical protein ACLQNE_11210, partial [Thermoguttaceae bacterium]